MAFKAEFIPSVYNFMLPTATLTNLPHSTQYNVRRRKNILYNKIQRHSLFLNAAPLPSEKTLDLMELSETESTPTIDRPAAQIEGTLNAEAKSLAQPMEELNSLGGQGFINHQVSKIKTNSGKNQVSFPESTDSVSSSVLSTHEVKATKVKRKKDPVSILELDSKSKPKKRRKN